MSTTKPKRTANHSAWRFVDKREPFTGSSLYGEAYAAGTAPYFSRGYGSSCSWLNGYEHAMYSALRPFVTYIVVSFATPIAYYVEGASASTGVRDGWYKVGQTFSQFTSRHRSGALRNVPGHMVRLTERRGDNIVDCRDCDTRRHFTYVKDAREAYYLHR